MQVPDSCRREVSVAAANHGRTVTASPDERGQVEAAAGERCCRKIHHCMSLQEVICRVLLLLVQQHQQWF
jgi:hypothetical protein